MIMPRRHLLYALLGFLSFGLLLFFLTTEHVLIEVFNTISLSFSVAVVVSYASVGWSSLKREDVRPEDILVIGIILIHSSVALTRIVSLSYRSFNNAWLVNSDFVSLSIYLSILASICQLNTAVVSDSKVPTAHWLKMGFLAGLSVGGLMFILHLMSLWK
jgi:hypothetical protein